LCAFAQKTEKFVKKSKKFAVNIHFLFSEQKMPMRRGEEKVARSCRHRTQAEERHVSTDASAFLPLRAYLSARVVRAPLGRMCVRNGRKTESASQGQSVSRALFLKSFPFSLDFIGGIC
jgi:hypothetical protein